MRITVHTDYALRTLLFLATHEGRKVPTKEIAAAYAISTHHLLKVVHRLGSLGYVEVVRGHGGGMILRRDPGTIMVGQVVRDFEPDLELVECFSEERNRCVISPSCGLKDLLHEAVDGFLGILDRRSIADLVEPRRAALVRLLEGG